HRLPAESRDHVRDHLLRSLPLLDASGVLRTKPLAVAGGIESAGLTLLNDVHLESELLRILDRHASGAFDPDRAVIGLLFDQRGEFDSDRLRLLDGLLHLPVDPLRALVLHEEYSSQEQVHGMALTGMSLLSREFR